MTFFAQDFLEMRGSVGYNSRYSRSFWGAGVYLNAPVLHLYYSVHSPDEKNPKTTHVFGLEIFLLSV